jgi:tetratricopeptide (TPR) repeat protein
MTIPNAPPYVPRSIHEAFEALAAGKPEQTLAWADAELAAAPNDSAWLTAKGLAHSALREAESAAQVYRALILLEPGVPEHHANLGNALLELANPQAAFAALRRSQQLGFSDGSVHFGLARAAFELGEVLLARVEVVNALKNGLDQDLEVALFYLKCLIALDEIDLAKDNAQRLQAAPMPADLAVEYAFLVLQLSDYAGAEAASLKVAPDAPEYPFALISLGLSYERSNQLVKMRETRAALTALGAEFAPDAPIATRMQNKVGQTLMQFDARLATREKHFDQAAAMLEPLLSTTLEPNLRIALQFELAKTLDALNKPRAAFALLSEVHEARFAQVAAAHPKMAFEEDPLVLLNQGFPKFVVQQAIDDRPDPVFVVGFPRSGTTLLEQLLDAHPALQSFDEQAFLQKCILRMQDMGLRYPAELDRLSAEQLGDLRTHYFSLCNRVSPNLSPGARYVDKNPLNLARLPLIKALFPRAKVIVVIRQPTDCVLSCYMQHFRAPAFAVTMRTLAATASMYDRVFSFYADARKQLTLDIFEMKYESFVANTAENAAALVEFLGLPWLPELLNFTERAKTRAISTPSYAAVTETVNTRALNRFQRYLPEFEASGANESLQRWMDHFSYRH